MLRLFLRALLPLLLAAVARADLTWDKPAQEFHRAPEDLQLRTSFVFHNSGAKPVEITHVATSCGCTAASLAQKRYDAGAAGQIDVEFTFGGRRGEQRKIITVSTDEGRQYALELLCFIDEALTIKPVLVFWRLGEAPEPKTVEVMVSSSTNLTITGVSSPNPAIRATLTAEEAGKRYLVKVEPVTTAQKESVSLTISTNYPPDAPKSYTIYARIK